MDAELRELYQEIILTHNRNPQNSGALTGATHCAEGHNPLCGDQLVVYLSVDNDKIEQVAFSGQGCAISQASASIMTERIKGMSEAEARNEVARFCALLSGAEPAHDALEKWGDAAALTGVRQFPARIKCAVLSWHTLQAALDGVAQTTTEGADPIDGHSGADHP